MKVLVLNPSSKLAKNVVRDLIYGCWCKGKRIAGATVPPLNLLYVATTIKEEGHDLKFLDAAAEQIPIQKVKKIVKNFDMVIISTSTMSFNEDISILKEFKKSNSNIITIIFGSHPTFMPKAALSRKEVDIIVRREPEFIIRDLLNAFDKKDDSWKNVKGIGYREGNKIVLNELYPFIENLDGIPIPDRTLLPKNFDYFNPLVKRMPYTTAMTGRGCPGLCTFCTVPTFYGNKNRYRSAGNVLKEMEILKSLGYREIFFRDETFSAYGERNVKICKEMIKKKIDLTWICNARVGLITKDMMQLMKKAGCHMIKFGVESGNQQILNNMKKGIKIDMTRKTFKWVHEVGIDTHAHNMLGCPGETKKTIEQTIKFVKEIDPTTATFAICTPYAGTPLFEEVMKKHKEIKDGSALNLGSVHDTAFFNQYFTSLKSEEIEDYLKNAYPSFYFRPTYIFKRLLKIKNLDELKRTTIAATNVFQFGVGK